jgi:hypothetical protein
MQSETEKVKVKRVGEYFHGEWLPCIGGPLEGQFRPVIFLLPGIVDIPNCGFTHFGDKYRLNDEKRCWTLIAQARQSAELAAGEIDPEMLPHTKAASLSPQPGSGK